MPAPVGLAALCAGTRLGLLAAVGEAEVVLVGCVRGCARVLRVYQVGLLVRPSRQGESAWGKLISPLSKSTAQCRRAPGPRVWPLFLQQTRRWKRRVLRVWTTG